MERTEIILHLRLGKFEGTVVIHLLRLGLYVHVVSLDLLLDAVEEGVFCSDRSFVPTIEGVSRIEPR
ncbi:hypothetical protein KYX90_13560, partial [Enterococcus lactis]|uniref:hypothetical protein n=1 Tax=Enterococcus lactis TaxID=357441 RepID=UPI001C7DFABB